MPPEYDPPPQNPDWLIMLYLSGDNNLSPEMVRAINEIAELGGPAHVGVTIQFDPVAPGVRPLRYVLRPKKRLELFATNGEVGEDAADPKTLSAFIQWSFEQFPNPGQRMLVLAGHGSGAVGDFLTDLDPKRRQRTLTIPRLARALDAARTAVAESGWVTAEVRADLGAKQKLIQILGMDSCLMSMAEVAYEVREHVDFFIASEGFVPNAGWPYALMLRGLRLRLTCKQEYGDEDCRRATHPRAMSSAIVRDYLRFYRDYITAGISVDLAAYDLSEANFTEIKLAVADLVKALGDLGGEDARNAVVLAHWKSQSFKFEQYTDLWDFCHLLREQVTRTPVKYGDAIVAACLRVQSAINRLVGRDAGDGIDSGVLSSSGRQGTEGAAYQHAYGLSVYFPWSLPLELRPILADGVEVRPDASPHFPDLAPYKELSFPRDSQWGAFLDTYLGATMRPPRIHQPAVAGLELDSRILADAAGAAPGEGGRFGPELGRFGPELGRLLSSVVGGTVCGSTKNPSQYTSPRPEFAGA